MRLRVSPWSQPGWIGREARRLLFGPRLERQDYSLVFAPIRPLASSHRAAAMPTIDDVVERLERLGYSPEVQALDEADEPAGPAPASLPLAGARVRITEKRARARRAGLVLRIGPALPGQELGLGFVDVADTSAGLYLEMAQFLIVALGEILSGLRFKAMYSALSPEPAATLLAQLPERPARLPR